MKRTCLLFSAIAFVLAANAATLTVEDFESKNIGDALVAWSYTGQAASTSATATVAANPNGEGKVAQLTTTGWNNILQLSVTLPAGKTIADYENISFDFYWTLEGDARYKIMRVYADTNLIYWDGANNYNKIADNAVWTNKSYAIDADVTSENTFQLAIGIEGLQEGTYYIDNITLEEKAVTTEVYVVEDYESKAENDALSVWEYTGGSASATAIVIADPVNSGEKCAQITVENYNNLLQLTATLPAGKTIANYEKISFDFYWATADYKKMRVYIDGNMIYNDTSYISQGNGGVWTAKNYVIPETTTSGNTVTIAIGLEGFNSGSYCIDNVKLTAREGEIPVNEGAYTFDFEADAVGDTYAMKAWNATDGTATVVANPNGTGNVVNIITTNWDCMLQLNVTLPTGKTIADCTKLDFDIYIPANDSDATPNYKNMDIYMDAVKVYGDSDYPNQAEIGTWTAKSYLFSNMTIADMTKNSFTLAFGMSTTDGNYYIDNVAISFAGTTNLQISQESKLYFAGNMLYTANAAQVSIYDVNGRNMTTEYNVSAIDMTGYASGVYVIKAIIDGQVTVRKIVK